MNEFAARIEKIPIDEEHYPEFASYINAVKAKMAESDVGGMVLYELDRVYNMALQASITCDDMSKLAHLMGVVKGIRLCREQVNAKYPEELKENENEVPPPNVQSK